MPRHTQAPQSHLQTTAPALLISELTSPELPGPLQAPDIQTDMEKVPASSTGRLRSIHQDRPGGNGESSSSGAVDERIPLMEKGDSSKDLGSRELKAGGSSSLLRTYEGRMSLVSMVLLVFQGTALSLVLRYSRARPGTQYLASVAVIYTEVVKLGICMAAQAGVCWHTAGERGLSMREEMVHQAKEIFGKSFPMIIPAGLFVMQQVLVIVAASHLDAVTFQICSQSFKIMPTAVFAVWLLGQYLTPMQWASLPVLAMGVVFVTLNTSSSHAQQDSSSKDLLLLGLGASALSGLSSAYAGVYFEKYVKGKEGQTLWIRNLQLSIYGVPLSILYTCLKDGSTIAKGGLHQGFDSLVWSVIALQVFGGLIVGMVVKYADNILKNFANALSVIFTVLGAMPLFEQYPSPWFIVGVGLVSLSVSMYNKASGQSNGFLGYCSGCRKLVQECDDRTGCLLLGGGKRGADGKVRGRCTLINSLRIAVLLAAVTGLLLLILALSQPLTQEMMQRGVNHIGTMFSGRPKSGVGLRGSQRMGFGQGGKGIKSQLNP